MPAEWEPHEATWIFWPTRAEQYLYGSASDFASVRDAFLRLIDVLCTFETIHVGADPSVSAEAKDFLGKRATVHELPLDDAWARDAAPTFTLRGNGREAVCWRFTGWGGRFKPFDQDAKAARRVAELMEAGEVATEYGIEGGAIHTDGLGTILTTAPVFFDRVRNPYSNEEELKKALLEPLGASRLVVLPAGFTGDDTGGHVDVVAAVAPTGEILLNDCTDSSDPNMAGSIANRETLHKEGFDVISVPQPKAKFSNEGRLAYSYLNFYPCNDALLAPIFGDSKDNYTCGLLREVFPDREVIPLDARPFYLGGGGIHCVTQPVPAVL